jgi:protein arginine kinase activator
MNCESCKKKPASVFYADESGGRHALCQSCAHTLGKITQYSPSADGEHDRLYIQTPTLSSLSKSSPLKLYCHRDDASGGAVCPYCATTLESIIEKDRVGCPECYTVFAEAIFPQALSVENAQGARMPSSRRARIDRIRSISELKAQIKLAVESENYELAATLRDKIRKLESARHT